MRATSCFAVGGREEEAAALGVAEELDGEAGKATRLFEPAKLARGDVQLEQAVRDVRVVLEVAGPLRLAGAEGPVQSAFAGRERPEQELAELAGRSEVVGALEPAARLGKRREGEPVPGRDRLVVPGGLHPLLAHVEEPAALLVRQHSTNDEPSVLERVQQLLGHAFLGRPREGQPLDAVCVRVLGRGEAAFGKTQLTEHVVEGLLDDTAVARFAGHDPGVEVRRGEQRVVVEHLLEVRHEPGLVDRVAVEAASDEVVHAAGGHRVERRDDHRQRVLVPAADASAAGTRASRRAGTWERSPTRPTPGRTGRAALRAASPSRLSVSGSADGAS